MESVEKGDLVTAKQLLEAENPDVRQRWVNPDSATGPCFTMLMGASTLKCGAQERRELVQLLLESGAHAAAVDGAN